MTLKPELPENNWYGEFEWDSEGNLKLLQPNKIFPAMFLEQKSILSFILALAKSAPKVTQSDIIKAAGGTALNKMTKEQDRDSRILGAIFDIQQALEEDDDDK